MWQSPQSPQSPQSLSPVQSFEGLWSRVCAAKAAVRSAKRDAATALEAWEAFLAEADHAWRLAQEDLEWEQLARDIEEM